MPIPVFISSTPTPPIAFQKRPHPELRSQLLGWTVVLSAMILAGCSALGPYQSPAMAYAIAASENEPGPTILSAEALRLELQGNAIDARAIGPHAVNDYSYVVPDHAWLTDTFLPYFGQLRTHLGLRHEGEGFDCDNFVALLKQQLTLANRRSRFVAAGDVPCAAMKVQQAESFGAVPSLGEDSHSVNLVRTSAGWFVVEPQDGTIARLEDYPNRDRILDLYF